MARWKYFFSTFLLLFLVVPVAYPGQDPATTIELPALVREALERNPEIQAARRNVDARRARIPQARAWPDPTLTIGYGGDLVPPFELMRGDPSSARQFMVEQEIPYPGKTRLRGRIASSEADAEATAIEAASRRVAAEVKQAYFELYITDQSLTTLAQDRDLFAKLARVAEIRYATGKGAQQDVIRAQIELTRLAERQTLLEQTRHTLEAQLNSLRDLPVDTPLGTTAQVRPSALLQSLEELQAAAESSFPAVTRQRTMVEGSRLAIDLARKEVRPNFSLGYTYMQRGALPDMYGITFSTSLPIFRRSKQDQAVREAALNLESAQRMVETELTTLRYRLKQEYLQAQTADRLMQLYAQGILPQSRLALESSLASFETGATDFQAVLGNLTTILDYELNYHEQLANHEKALARMEELTGLELIR